MTLVWQNNMKDIICLYSPITLIILRPLLPLTLNVLIQEHPLFLFLQIVLVWYSPLFQNNIMLLEVLKQDIYLKYLCFRWICPQQNNPLPLPYAFPLDLPWEGGYSWPSSGGIWYSASSLDLVANYSTMIPAISSVSTSWNIYISTQGQYKWTVLGGGWG